MSFQQAVGIRRWSRFPLFRYSFWLLLCWLPLALFAAEPEPRSMQILDDVVGVREALIANGADRNAIFMTVWDFDGTILDGDCSEGLIRDGRVIYPGLAQLAIEHKLSPQYSGKGGFEAFWHDYRLLDERVGHWLAYPYIVQMMTGGSVDQLAQLSEQSFKTLYQPHYYAGSMYIIRGLQAEGVEVHVISASAERFVRGAAATIAVDPARIHGIRVQERDGQMTEELVYPVTWAAGKRERLQEIIRERSLAEPGREIYVIGGFGNSYNTDGPFMAWIAGQALPVDKPVVVMINGGAAPEAYNGLFTTIEQRAVVAE